VLLIGAGYSPWWGRYFGDMRYSPLLGKFYTFDTMLWGMALLIGLALVYTLALRKRVTPVDGLTIALLVALGLIYPVLFPAGLLLAGCFLFLLVTRLAGELPPYTRWELARVGFAILFSVLAVAIYLRLVMADRDVATFALSGRGEIRVKAIRYLGAMGPFLLLAALPVIGYIRRRHGPALLLALPVAALSAIYIVVDLTQLEYKFVLAATIGLALLAAAAVDPLFRRRPRLGAASGAIAAAGLAAINLLLVFHAGAHIPGTLERGAPLDESSFRLALPPSAPDAAWTRAIREQTPENTVVIARRPGVKLSALVGRSMYVPSDLAGGFVPGYNLDQRFYLLQQRGYSAEEYERRLGVVEALCTSDDEDSIVQALHNLKELRRPLAIYYPDRETYSLRWLETRASGRALDAGGQETVWFVDDPSTLP
jgi:hypothetical protein